MTRQPQPLVVAVLVRPQHTFQSGHSFYYNSLWTSAADVSAC